MTTNAAISHRWLGRLQTRRNLLTAARRRHVWLHTAATRALVAKRKAQVAFAERVVERHRRAPRVSASALRDVAPWLTPRQALELGAALGPAFKRYGITTPLTAAMAVAQFAHESAGFHTTTEYATGSAYEGRRDLGNVRAGDGRRFRGRGYIQVTGRNNYAAASRAFGVDFTRNPTLLATPKYAALVSCWWWAAHGLNRLASDTGIPANRRCLAVTRVINGGTNGLEERQAYYKRALAVADQLVPR